MISNPGVKSAGMPMSQERYRRRTRPQHWLPDRVSGLGIGVAVPIVFGGYFPLRSVRGGGVSECDQPLPRPSGLTAFTADGLQAEDDALVQTLQDLIRDELAAPASLERTCSDTRGCA